MHGVQKPELLHHQEPAQALRAGGMEEVLPAVQQAPGAQGIQVVATEALASTGRSWLGRGVEFLRGVQGETRTVTWPTWEEVKKATTVIVIFVALPGLVIGWMDWLVQQSFVAAWAKLF